jgi:hypothetical protein
LPDTALAAGTYSRQLLDRLLIDLSWNSSRLEGNTYSLLETHRLLEAGAAAAERSPLETQMLLNHKQAILREIDGRINHRLYVFHENHVSWRNDTLQPKSWLQMTANGFRKNLFALRKMRVVAPGDEEQQPSRQSSCSQPYAQWPL